MRVKALINEDNTEAALFFADPLPGYTITINAEQIDELINILISIRNRLDPPPEQPGKPARPILH